MQNILTVDVEDYYHVSGMADVARVEDWGSFESRIDVGMDILLEELDDAPAKATFFVLGWVAQRRPDLVRKIAGLGHEIGAHGMMHMPVTGMTRAEFAEDLRRAVGAIRDAAGTAVRSYRAPDFSITRETRWAFEVLAEQGLRYDSSVVPVRRRRGGMPGADLGPHVVETPAGPITEVPLSVWSVMGRLMPVAGGGFFRLYPYWLTRKAVRRINAEGRPAVVYVHPWEFDLGQPHLKSRLTRNGFNHYYGIGRNRAKLRRLLRDFSWGGVREGSGLPPCHCEEPCDEAIA